MNLRLTLSFFFGVLYFSAISCGTFGAQDDASPATPHGEAVATFAGGCFWCVESDFDHVAGVIRTISGYTGGNLVDPTYKQVSMGGTGHLEAVQIFYNPRAINYETLLDIFWRSVDPTDEGGQFCDRGKSYITGIFANSLEQKRLAESSKHGLAETGFLGHPIVTLIEMAGPFYPAEDYHQNYYEKNPIRYEFYRFRCGRDARIRELWGKEAHSGIMK
jgi:peptide-methionine (S)-S-oxide reductase